MPFTAHDLRYNIEQSYSALQSYLYRYAQRYLGSLNYDAYEVDLVVGHVVEQLVRLGLLGCGDSTPPTVLDSLSNAQFYTFLQRSTRNKAIDRLRKRHLVISTFAEIGTAEETDSDEHLLNEAVEPLWGAPPFATPEEIALALASQLELRNLLKHCIESLHTAPRQLLAVIQELEEYGATELLKNVLEELKASLASLAIGTQIPHISQHRDHAHKKLRHCLQEQSTNLAVAVALRLIHYGVSSLNTDEFNVELHTLVHEGLSDQQVRTGLSQLVYEGLLDWHGEEVVRLTSAQMKHLTRFYREE